MIVRLLKHILPDRPCLTKVLRGPFRGARVFMNPRNSLRKVLGIYEHELNGWVEQALRRVQRVLDVGANDGYFAFGCAAAFTRMGIQGEIFAYEPQEVHLKTLRESLSSQRTTSVRITLVPAFAGAGDNNVDTVALDSSEAPDRNRTLIKIDVEGAELDVIAGAHSWLNPTNLFLIEVHSGEFIAPITETFLQHGIRLRRIDQQPYPILGREERDESNWWLVSELSPVDDTSLGPDATKST